MASSPIVGLFVFAAVVYGVVHDQITARVCLEYFTIGHPRMFASDEPTLHALYWGVAATWWAGFAVGILVAVASRLGRLPKLTWRQQCVPAGVLMATMGVTAAAGGLWVLLIAHDGQIDHAFDQYFGNLPISDKRAFLVDFTAHNLSYAVGFAGGVALAAISVGRRWAAARNAAITAA